MSTFRPVTRWICGLSCLALTLMLPAGGGMAQSDDRGVLQRFLEDNLSGAGREVRIAGFEGALTGRATLDQLTIADADGIWLTVEDAVLDWNRSALFRGALDVEELSAERIILARPPFADDSLPAAEATGFALPDLPVSVDLGALSVARVEIGEAFIGESIALNVTGAATLGGGEGSANLGITRLNGVGGTFALDGAYSNSTDVLALSLDVAEPAGGLVATLLDLPGAPPLSLTVNGDDPLSDFTAEIALETDGAPRLAGEISVADRNGSILGRGPGREFLIDLGGDLRPLVPAQYHDFLGDDVRLEAQAIQFEDGTLSVDQLDLNAQALDLSGTLALDDQRWPTEIDIAGTIQAGDDGTILLPIGGAETRIAGATLDVDFDAAAGEAWQLAAQVDGLDRDGLTVEDLSLLGTGVLRPGLSSVNGDLEVQLSGIAQQDPGLNEAVGDRLSGAVGFDWTRGRPFALRDLNLVGADYGLTGGATIQGLDGQFDLEIRLGASLTAEDLSRFATLSGQQLAGQGGLELGGTVSPVSGAFDLVLTGQTTDLALGQEVVDPLIAGTSDLTLSARRDETGVTLRQLALRNDQAEINATGTVATGNSALDFAAVINDLSNSLEDVAGPALFAGKATQAGDVWSVAADVSAPGDLAGRITGSVDLTDGAVGEVSGNADLTLGDASTYAAFAGRDLRGQAQLAINGSGHVTNQTGEIVVTGTTRDLAVGIAQADRLLAGTATLNIRADTADQVVRLRALDITSPRTTLTSSGVYQDQASTAQFDARLVDLGDVLDNVTGAARVNGTAQQSGDTWSLVTDIEAPGRTTARVDGDLTLNADGSPGDARGQARVAVGNLGAFARLTGQSLSGSVQLDANGSGDVSAQTFDLDLSAIAQNLGIGQAVADQLLGGQTTLDTDLRLTANQTLVIDTLAVRGREITADLRGQASTSSVDVTYDLALRDLGVLADGFDGRATGQGTLQAGSGPITLNTALTGPGGTRATIAGQIARDAQSANLDISGQAPLALANQFTAPNILDGTAQFDLGLNGPLALNSLSGTVRTAGSRLSLPSIANALTDINVEARLANGGAALIARTDLDSGGRITADGRIGLTAPYQADLTLGLDNLRLSDPGLYETQGDGRFTLNGPLTGGARIAGALNLEETELRIPATVAGAGEVLEGLVHLNDTAAVRQTRVRAGLLADATRQGSGGGGGASYPLDIAINAPSRIFVRGRGLDAELGGALRLRGTTSNVITEGRFDLIRGRLDILGKRLELTEAFAQLQGDFNPYIRAVAATSVDDTQIEIVVEGPASAPEVSFTSSPELPETEVLALLLFGRDLTQISALQALQLANAVRTLAGGGGEGVVGQLRNSFGLDDLDITTNSEGEAGLRAGRYISDNAYTDVTVDSSGTSEINLNITVSPNVTLRGSASSEGNTSLGIFFEKDY